MSKKSIPEFKSQNLSVVTERKVRNDSLNLKDKEINRKEERKQLDHQIIKNVYTFIIFLTQKRTVIFMFILFIFVIYPISKMTIMENSSVLVVRIIHIYANAVIGIFPAFLSFIGGAIISDWVTVKYKN